MHRTSDPSLLSSPTAKNLESGHYFENTHFSNNPQHEYSSMMLHHSYPPAAATESYFFLDNTAPQTGKRAYPNFGEEVSWCGSNPSADIQGRHTNHHYMFSSSRAPMYEPVLKKARVVCEDEGEEPAIMNLARMKRALQQLETEESLSVRRDTKRARMMDLPIEGPSLPPQHETRIVLRDPSMPPRDSSLPYPREIQPSGPMQEAEKAVFNSLLLQRISNRYRGAPIQLDVVDSKLQELIRGSMRNSITWIDEEDRTSSSNCSIASCISSNVTMEEDPAPADSSYFPPSEESSMMTF